MRRHGACAAVLSALLVAACSRGEPLPEDSGGPPPPDAAHALPAGIPRYASPEAFLEDYRHAMSFVSSTETVNRYLVEYSACMAFKEGSADRCAYVDEIIGENMQLFTCRPMFAKGMMTRELVEGRGGITYCLMDVDVWKEVARSKPDFVDTHEEPPGEAREFCRRSIPFWRDGDLKGYCSFLHEMFPDDPEPRPCPDNYAYIPGKPERCPDYGGDANWSSYCRMSSRLITAIREKKPALISDLQYAPLVDPKATCELQARKFLREYSLRVEEYLASRSQSNRPRPFR